MKLLWHHFGCFITLVASFRDTSVANPDCFWLLLFAGCRQVSLVFPPSVLHIPVRCQTGAETVPQKPEKVLLRTGATGNHEARWMLWIVDFVTHSLHDSSLATEKNRKSETLLNLPSCSSSAARTATRPGGG